MASLALPRHERAAVLIQMGIDGSRNAGDITAEYRDLYQFRKQVRLLAIECANAMQFHSVFRLVCWCFIVLAVFERPQWTYDKHNWQESGRYPSTNISYLPDTAVAILGLFFLAAMSICVYVEVRLYRLCLNKDRSSFVLLILLLLCWLIKFADYFSLLISVALQAKRSFSSTPIEIAFLLLAEKKYLLWLSITGKSLPRIAALISLLGLILAAFTVLALMIFDPNSEEARK